LLAGFASAESVNDIRRIKDYASSRSSKDAALMQQYNCVGCHEIEKRGGYIRKYYQEIQTLAPPVLNGEGEKVQSNWFFSFLKAPVPIRPWLELRMPTFGFSDEHANQLVVSSTGLPKLKSPMRTSMIRRSHPIISTPQSSSFLKTTSLFQLSQTGRQEPEGPVDGWRGSDFGPPTAHPNWILKWLKDPQKVQPGTKMPSFYPGGPDNILGGKEDLQIEALRDYLI